MPPQNQSTTGDYLAGRQRVIHKDIPDGARLTVANDLIVEGNIGSARIDCGGSLTVSGGILGRGQGLLRARGSVKARFLSRVTVECAGDLLCESEICSCHILAGGKVSVPGGSISGGTITALSGVDAATLGTDLGEKTRILAGVDGLLEQTKGRLVLKRDALTTEIEKIRSRLAPHVRNLKSLRQQQLDAIRQLNRHWKTIEDARASVEVEIMAVETSSQGSVSHSVFARSQIFAGVTLDFGKAREEIRNDLPGPVRIWYDDAIAEIRTNTPREPASPAPR